MAHGDDTEVPDRRTVLKLIGGAAGAATTLPGSATAIRNTEREKMVSLKNEYNQPQVAVQAINQYGSGILTHLKNRGVLETADVAELVPKSLQSVNEYREATPGIFVSSFTFEGEYSARISARIETNSHTVGLFIHPHADTHYAVVKPSAEGEKPVVVEDTKDGIVAQNRCGLDGLICRYEGNQFDCCPPFFGCTNTEFEKIVCESGACYAGFNTGCCAQPRRC